MTSIPSTDSPKLCRCGCGKPAPEFIRGHGPQRLPAKKSAQRKPIHHRKFVSIDEFFNAFVTKSQSPDGCWRWTGCHTQMGYGRFRLNHKSLRAHRAAYERAYGPIPGNLLVCHKCDVRDCVRPDHLFLGTHEDNARDKESKGRGEHFRKYTPDTVRKIRALSNDGAYPTAIARSVGMSKQNVCAILARKTWKHIP